MAEAPATLTSAVGSLAVPGARLHYEVRGSGPLLVLVGAPMNADPFAPLADLLATDHTVLTTDPRGINRSRVQDPAADSTPELRADDLSRLIAHLDVGPATVFGSCGGAVAALALVQTSPEQVSTVIAHEPPLNQLLEDGAQLRAQTEDYCATYLAGDILGAWQKFFAVANVDKSVEDLQETYGGVRDPQVVADEHFWFAHELRPSTQWRPNLAALRSVPSRVMVGIGEGTAGQVCDRNSRALAIALDIEPMMFPDDHIGFAREPEAFAHRLRTVIR